MTGPLSSTETAQWLAWKRANDAVLAAVAEEIHGASALSVADFSVLSRIIENGDGRMSQQELGEMLDWKRARLSRQLTRMAERGLLQRETAHGRRLLVTATDQGADALAAARPAHARAVRRALLARVAPPDSDTFWNVIQHIAAAGESSQV